MINPLGNVTVLPEATWHPEPTIRGTSSILTSCLITISLCIWTAVHLNLPEHRKESQQVYRKILWLALGLFAPEVVVWIAWRQRSKMKELSCEMRRNGFTSEKPNMWASVRYWVERQSAKIQIFLLLRAKDWPELAEPRERPCLSHNRIHPWTDVHSWYAVMGGLAFEDTAVEELQFMPGDRQRMTLMDDIIVWLACHRPALLPDISKTQIKDKSKSGGLGKFVTCWQATYFCAQCVFRLCMQYSISLLELNVFTHALCALTLFWIWWDKPQDVQEPTLITDRDALDICAFLCLRPSAVFRGPLLAGSCSKWIPCQPCPDFVEVIAPTTVTMHYSRIDQVDSSLIGRPDRVRLLFGPCRQPCLKVLDTFWTVETMRFLWREGELCELDIHCIRRLMKAYQHAIEAVSSQLSSIRGVVDRCADVDWSDMIRYSGMTHGDHLIRWFPSHCSPLSWTLAGLTLAGGCYGGLHLIAWTCQFPSYAETILWRGACITILATGPTVIAFVLWECVIEIPLPHVMLSSKTYWKYIVWPLWDFMRIVRFPLFSSWIICYTLCRAFLILECFIMLAHLPEAALEIPRWATYVPHIT